MQNTYLENDITVEEYNQEPVYYCKYCLSLAVKELNSHLDYCDDCGSTEIETTDIFTWRKMYKEKYGEDF